MSEQKSDELIKLIKQNEIIISLLGRMAFTSKQIYDIVTANKRNNFKSNYVNGYNALDGSKTVSEIASVIGIQQSTLSPILLKWEELGIIYEVEKSGGKFYRKIFPIEEDL
ncbi:MAG: winged helix-turn-helix domain-containing protein [Candidatus Bathyarchaeum tardum]|nr:MAG: winged helix-turn-helix domain-containing protein [Candidatus Bathyarchaeum tardum]